jgi:phosphoribosyl 1,2-cyclic phosphate phosphodiesterase
MIKITILGCGASLGVPVLNCKCAVCVSKSIKNKRLRSSILISCIKDEQVQNNVLVDCGFDVKTQLMRTQTSFLSAVILTHNHADHLSGLDELRAFSSPDCKAQIPFYMTQDSRLKIRATFDYMFSAQHLVEHVIDYYDEIKIGDINIRLFKQDHTVMDSLGFRINDFVYANDIAFFYQSSKSYLQNLQTFVVDCSCYKSTNVHAGLERVLQWCEEFRPKTTYLTNLSHEIDYASIKKILPKNIMPAYDNLSFYI